MTLDELYDIDDILAAALHVLMYDDIRALEEYGAEFIEQLRIKVLRAVAQHKLDVQYIA